MTKTLILVPLLLASLAFASGDIRLSEVGIEGYYSSGAPAAVTVEVHNPTLEAQQFVITYEIKTPLYRNQQRTNYVSQPLQLAPGEKRMHSTPILLGYNPQLRVKVEDSKGQLLGEDEQELNKSAGDLVVLLCQDASRCDSAQKGLQSAGTAREQADKQQRLTFVRLTRPFDKWWKYLGSPTVVLADAMPLKAEQRQALEEYVRHGGTLVDVSGTVGPVLDKYTDSAMPQRVAKGALYRTTYLNDPQLSAYLSGNRISFNYFPSYGGDLAYFRSHLGASFHFPRLRWLLVWFAAYILVVGPLNFFILRKLKRLEFGWVSIPLVAVVFAIALYWWGARDRPRQFGVDEIAVYWLDDRSPVAGVDLGVRVFSPERTQVTVSVPTEAIFISGGDAQERFGMEGIFFGRARSPVEGPRLWLGPPQQLQLEMARWSFSDLEYDDVRSLPGTVLLEKPGMLTNATGKTFREAVYVDGHGKLFELGAVGPGSIALPSSGGVSLTELRDRRARGENVPSSTLVGYLISPPQMSNVNITHPAFL